MLKPAGGADKEIEDFPCAGLAAIRNSRFPFVSSWLQGELSIPRPVGVQLAFQRVFGLARDPVENDGQFCEGFLRIELAQ